MEKLILNKIIDSLTLTEWINTKEVKFILRNSLGEVMDFKKQSRRIQQELNQLGNYNVKLTHVQEALARSMGHKSRHSIEEILLKDNKSNKKEEKSVFDEINNITLGEALEIKNNRGGFLYHEDFGIITDSYILKRRIFQKITKDEHLFDIEPLLMVTSKKWNWFQLTLEQRNIYNTIESLANKYSIKIDYFRKGKNNQLKEFMREVERYKIKEVDLSLLNSFDEIYKETIKEFRPRWKMIMKEYDNTNLSRNLLDETNSLEYITFIQMIRYLVLDKKIERRRVQLHLKRTFRSEEFNYAKEILIPQVIFRKIEINLEFKRNEKLYLYYYDNVLPLINNSIGNLINGATQDKDLKIKVENNKIQVYYKGIILKDFLNNLQFKRI